MSSAICFNLDQSKILSSVNGLKHLGKKNLLYQLAQSAHAKVHIDG